MQNFINRRKAFTFIEMLVVVSLFAILSLAIFSTFACGMGLWRRIQDNAFAKRRPFLVLEKLATELRQTLEFSKIGIDGKSDGISFPILSSEGEIIKVTYSLGEDSLSRTEENYKGILWGSEEDTEGRTRILLSGVEELKFSFARKEEGKVEYSWSDLWSKKDGIPLIVKIELKNKDESFTKTVRMPVS
jgi:prepilin-type N-terminal cleavage/methylation domain-containing protein